MASDARRSVANRSISRLRRSSVAYEPANRVRQLPGAPLTRQLTQPVRRGLKWMPLSVASCQQTDARAWTAETIDAPASWRQPLSRACLVALDEAARGADFEGRPLTEARLSAPQLSVCRNELIAALNHLESGRGFVILGRLPVETLSALEQTLRYCLIGQALGVPFRQDVQGPL